MLLYCAFPFGQLRRDGSQVTKQASGAMIRPAVKYTSAAGAAADRYYSN